MEIKIREVNREWALDIEMPDRIQVIYFASRQNALQVMHYLQLIDNIIKLDKKKLQTPMTNYNRIKAMNIDELAEFLDDMQTDALFLEGTINDLKYPTDWKKYLESEVDTE